DVADDAADEVAVWVAVVRADRELFGRGDWPGVDFPEQTTPQQITLSGQELRIGRGGLPAGDLEIELDDPAVSRLHGLLVRQADGSYSVVDRGSTNGTTLNDDDTPLTPNVAVSLGDGDRIHVGAWTTISLVRRSGDGGQPGNAPPPNP